MQTAADEVVVARILLVHGSKMGGTAGIAERIGGVLARRGHEVELVPGRRAPAPAGYDAVVVGGALYAMRWRAEARRYVRRHARALRALPTWFFSSGPLDDSAAAGAIPPTRQVAGLMHRAGCTRHRTFGGRLPENATGFPARAMARESAGDWRNWDDIDAWAGSIADSLVLVR